jgi:hypothetical protein
MARGWESKSVESQQDEARRPVDRGVPMSPEARAVTDRRRMLSLSLARVRDELSAASRPAHRATLERAAAALEAEISALDA